MTKIRQVLDAKGRDLISINPDSSVFDAIKLMAERNVGSVVVMDGDRPAGIVTERHYARDVTLKGKASPTTPVRDIMEKHMVCVTPDHTVQECMAIMTDKHVRHLPVMDGSRLDGMISIGDLVKTIIADQKFTIQQLEDFIKS